MSNNLLESSQFFELSFKSELPSNLLFKSTSCVMMEADLDFYQIVGNPKSMYILTMPQLFIFFPEFFVVGTQSILNKN